MGVLFCGGDRVASHLRDFPRTGLSQEASPDPPRIIVILFDSGSLYGRPSVIIAFESPRLLGGWRNWVWCWVTGFKSEYRLCGITVSIEAARQENV